jgi:hypothetical protein
MRHTTLDIRSRLEGLAIEALQQQPLAARHTTEVVPLLLRIMPNRCSPTAVPIWISVLNRDDVVVFDRSRGCNSQRKRLEGLLVQRSPDVDETIATLEKLICLTWEVSANSLSYSRSCLINVYTSHRRTSSIGCLTANSVIKEEDPVRARDVVEEKLFKLWVVVLLDRIIIDEVDLAGGWNVLDDLESITV